MSDKLPFEDAFERKMNDLPAGDKDASWQKMKALLEEKDERKPFVWINIYTICGCLIIAALFGIWLMLSYENKGKQNLATISKNSDVDTQQINKLKGKRTTQTSYQSNQSKDALLAHDNKTVSDTTYKNTILKIRKSGLNMDTLLSKNNPYNSLSYISALHRNNRNHNKSYHNLSGDDSNKQRSVAKIISNNIHSKTSDSLQLDQTNNKSNQTASFYKEDTTLALQQQAGKITETNIITDTITKKNILRKDTASVAKQTKASFKKSKQYFLEAGIQLSQSLPLSGEKITAYNYHGNKNMLYDYVPSVYIKFEKYKHWFIQTEFTYAAPQLIKPFSYSQKTKIDYALSTVTVTTNHLQKAYYTQLPVSFNYYIKPHLFAGVGAKYSWFHGAVTQQETVIKNILADSQSIAKQIMPVRSFTDSFLYKSQAAVLFQTGYSWRKWAFTLRYGKAFQPFITYTLPEGTIDNKRNSSFQLIIDYSLFKSNKFNSKPLK